jgi:hypothetical protein
MTDYIREVLTELGYSLRDYGKEFRAKPIYRNSDNATALAVNKQTGRWADYALGASGRFEELIKLTLNLNSVTDAKKWLDGKGPAFVNVPEKPTIKVNRAYPIEILQELIPDHTYWNKRGISTETLRLFKGGLSTKGKMAGRYVFPVFNSKKEVIGFAGRDIYDNSSRPKWKLIGDKSEWRYPMFVNLSIIQKYKKVFLLESVGDMLALWDAGIQNTMVLFGLKLGPARLKFLLSIDPSKIIISLNNDFEQSENHGEIAAESIRKDLLRNFDGNQIVSCLPIKKDFGEMSKEEIKEWYKKAECL